MKRDHLLVQFSDTPPPQMFQDVFLSDIIVYTFTYISESMPIQLLLLQQLRFKLEWLFYYHSSLYIIHWEKWHPDFALLLVL